MKKLQKLPEWVLTIAGLLIAIGNAALTINWMDFVWSKEYPKLIASILIAVGGWLSDFKKPKAKKSNDTASR